MTAYWAFEEAAGSPFSDSINQSQTNCLQGCPGIGPGLLGNGLNYSEVFSDLQFVAAADLEWPAGASFSIEYWLKRNSVDFGGQEAIVSRSTADGSRINLWAGLGTDGRARLLLIDALGNQPSAALSSSPLTDGAWHHIVLVRDGARGLTRLYVDGGLVAEQQFTYSGNLGVGGDLFGLGLDLSSQNDFYGGELDELAFYQRALSAFEIVQHHADAKVGMRLGYCPAVAAVRIMPLGDSVTAGYNSLGWDTDLMVGYRQKLYLDLLADGYAVDFVGSASSGELTPPLFDFDHEGHGGWTASMIADFTYSGLQAHPADIVLLHAGTNFVSADPAPVARILDEIDRFSPETTVVLAKIINKKVPEPEFSLFNQNLEQMVAARLLAGDKIILVDQENALIYPDDMDDTLHPLLRGYEKMSAVWKSALQTILPVPNFVAPSITSAPLTQATLNIPYVYQVKADGMPPPSFRLSEAPPGMMIDADNGVITWAPAAGQYPVTVEAVSDSDTARQSFLLSVSESLFLDTGAPGTLATGLWAESAGVNPYGALSLWTREVGAQYSFNPALNGSYQVSLWWTEYASRCTSVPVEIYDGTQLLTRTLINQQKNGGQWNLLGTFDFSGNASVKILSTNIECTTNADGAAFVPREKPALSQLQIEGPLSVNRNSSTSYQVRAVYADGSSLIIQPDSWSDDSVYADISVNGILTTFAPDSTQICQLTADYTENGVHLSAVFEVTLLSTAILILDNGEPGTSFFGDWADSSGPEPYGTGSVWNRSPGMYYNYQVSISGTYDLFLWWTEWPSRCNAVPVDIYNGTLLLDRVLVNQQVDGGQWNLLGTYSFTSLARVSLVSQSAECTTNADAVQFVPGVKPALDHLVIEGPERVNRNSTVIYSLRAFYADGSSQLVTPDSWTTDCPFASISPEGVLTTQTVSTDQPCRLSASYSEAGLSRSDTFDFTIVSSVNLILDSGDSGISFSGNWYVSGAADPYGADSLWSRDPGGSYSYQPGLSGDFEISLWWTEFDSRCTAVPVEIYDGTLLINRVLINQRMSGGQWNSLGTYSFTQGARVNIISTSADCSTSADAAQFATGLPPLLESVQIEGPASLPNTASATYLVRAFYPDASNHLVQPDSWNIDCPYASIGTDGTLTTQDVSTDQICRISVLYTEAGITRTASFDLLISSLDILILDTGAPGTSAVGLWEESGGANPYGALSLWSRTVGDSYSFEVPADGQYALDLWWTGYVSRCTAVQVEIYNDGLLLDRVWVNQQVNGGQWNTLGQYLFTGSAKATILSENTGCSTNADAFRLVPVF